MALPREPEVNSREQLAQYVDRLRDEFEQRGANWENQTLDRYLDALAACIRDHRGTASWTAPDTDAAWGHFAFILGAATVYE